MEVHPNVHTKVAEASDTAYNHIALLSVPYGYLLDSILVLFILLPGPFCMNGVPLRRLNQAYVIATQTKIDLSGFSVPDQLSDDYFRRTTPQKRESSEIFTDSKQVYNLTS